MKIKTRMIGMDLDGTLLKTNKELTAYTKDVLRRAIDQGIIVMPATGRPISGVPEELTKFPGIRYAVTANGARVIDMKKNEAIGSGSTLCPVASIAPVSCTLMCPLTAATAP